MVHIQVSTTIFGKILVAIVLFCGSPVLLDMLRARLADIKEVHMKAWSDVSDPV